MISIVFLIVQFLALFLSCIVLFNTAKECRIKPTIHNLPYVIAFVMLELFVILISQHHLLYFFMAGFAAAAVVFSKYSNLEGDLVQELSLGKRIFTCLIIFLFLPQALMYIAFYYFHNETILEHFKKMTPEELAKKEAREKFNH